MIALDLIVKSIFVYLRNYGMTGVRGAIIPVNIIIACCLFFVSSFSLYTIGFSLIDVIGVIGIGFYTVLLYYLSNWLLNFIYIKSRRELVFKNRGLIFFYYFLGPMLFFGSIFLLFLSLRYMRTDH